MLHVPGLFIAPSKGRGRGVYTSHNLRIDDIIEICPVVAIPKNQRNYIDKTILYDYYFLWPHPKDSICIALGYASIYNHSSKPNAEAIADSDNQSFTLKCIEDIEAGQEIFINYEGKSENKIKLWFDPV